MHDPTSPLTEPDVADLRRRVAALGHALPDTATVRAGLYGDSRALCDALVALIVEGRKRAGTSLLWAHEADGEPIPRPGDLEIVVDADGEPVLVTRSVRVTVVPFDEVDAAYAAIEGEGDGSLASWREGHWAFFGRECARLGRTPAPDMPVVCDEFEVLHRLPGADRLVPRETP